jgi:hypothetical protein
MTHLSKFSFKQVERAGAQKDPRLDRRNKVTAAVDEQKQVVAAALNGETYTVRRDKWMTNDQGERVLTKAERRVRPWFFEQDGGWYVQCRYGARVLLVDGANNAVFVKSLKEVNAVLDAFRAAAQAGELDAAIIKATERKAKTKAQAANDV